MPSPATMRQNVYLAIQPAPPTLDDGAIIEGNQIANCGLGVECLDAPALDLVIWNNYFRNVWAGIRCVNNTATSLGTLERHR